MSRNLIIIISIVVVIIIIVAIVLIKRKKKTNEVVIDFTKPVIVEVKKPDGTTYLIEKTYQKNAATGEVALKTKEEVKTDAKLATNGRG
jgi:hypothetical protein